MKVFQGTVLRRPREGDRKVGGDGGSTRLEARFDNKLDNKLKARKDTTDLTTHSNKARHARTAKLITNLIKNLTATSRQGKARQGKARLD